LTYNVIDLERLANTRWEVAVEVRKVSSADGPRQGRRYYSYRTEVGESSPYGPLVFAAERMDDCHRAMARVIKGRGQLANFISIVDDSRYLHPSTARLVGRDASEAEVERCFKSLHPEYDDEHKWTDIQVVNERLDRTRSRIQFQHGPRMFATLPNDQTRETEQPIRRAIRTLESSTTHAFVGLYDRTIDAVDGEQPLPGLVSLQFVPDGNFLDAVATFRKIELSFWWVVNMMEVRRLLEWAATTPKKKMKARRITFYAALSEWREDDPEAGAIAELDELSYSSSTALVSGALLGQNDSASELRRLLEDKLKWTSERNLDGRGLELVEEALTGLTTLRRTGEADLSLLSSGFGQAVASARIASLRAITSDRSIARAAVTQLKASLSQALNEIDEALARPGMPH